MTLAYYESPYAYDQTTQLLFSQAPTTLDELIRRLDGQLNGGLLNLATLDAYYEGEQPLRFMVPALQEEFDGRITELVLNWPRLGADAYENRLDIEGFRFAGKSSADQDLADIWQENDCDEQSQQGHLDSLVLGRSYVLVGAGDTPDDAPIVTIESPFQVTAMRDPRTRKITAGWKRWQELDGSRWGSVYLPNATHVVTLDQGHWRVVSTDPHEMGRPPIASLTNRPRTLRPNGVSEFYDILPIADAANKMATDMMVSGEFHAMPRRWAFGLKAEDFVDEAGNPLPTWSVVAGRLWSTEQKASEVAVGQFPESDLAVFHNTIKVLAQLASQQLALPPHYLAFTSDNPTSADAIRASETQLVKRVERKHTFLGGAWEDVMRMALRIQTGEWVAAAKKLETVWRDPSTPTIAQKADAVVKLASTPEGDPILPVEQARIDLGYTQEQRDRMREMALQAREADPMLAAARTLTGVEPAQPAPGAPTTTPAAPGAPASDG